RHRRRPAVARLSVPVRVHRSEAPMTAPHRDGIHGLASTPVRAGRGWRARLAVVCLALVIFLTGGGVPVPAANAQDEIPAGAVVVVPITGTIDLGLAPFLSRVLDEAEADGAAAVV